MNMDEAVSLFTGIKQIEHLKGFDKTQALVVISDQPLPCTLLNIASVFYDSPV